ncbi:MAG TPA: GNAT family protein [Candidatus Nanopelagicales bacterium]|nr:GNAT family protein [Candidatus Nanopelagicales bacterium]
MKHEVVLAGEGLRLRPFRRGHAPDAAFLTRMAAERASRRWSGSLQRIHADADGGAGWLAERDTMPGSYDWVVEDASSTDILGRVNLHRNGTDADAGTEVGYWTVPPARGRQVARRAARLAARYGHEQLGLLRIGLVHAVANPASCRVALGASFRLEGTARASHDHEGVALDMHVHARLAGDGWDPLPVLAKPPAPVELRGEGLLLRAWRPGDVGALAAAVDDPQIARWNPVRGDSLQDWIEAVRSETDAVTWAIEDGASGTVAGKISLFHLDAANAGAEAGYWVLAAHRGRGLGRRALAAAGRYAFEVLGVERVELFHAVANPASCAVAAGAGFALEGSLRSSYRYADGVLHDEHVHARLATDPVLPPA